MDVRTWMDAMNIGFLLLQRGAGRANRGGPFAGRPAGGSERPKGGGKGRCGPGPGSVSLYSCSGCRRRDGRCNTAPGVANDRWLFEQATDAMKLYRYLSFPWAVLQTTVEFLVATSTKV